jgi:Leucine-rich repeat (LRR) protein
MFLNFKKLALVSILTVLFSCTAIQKGPDGRPSSASINNAANRLTEAGVPLQKDPGGSVRWIEAKKGEFTDESLGLLPFLPDLEWLEIGESTLTARGLNHLRKCTALKRLYIHDMNLEGEDLAWISTLLQLEALSLQRTKIDGRFLINLNAVESLKVLNLSGNPISDDDMARIASFKNLEVLALADTEITGSGIRELREMARLNELNIERCGINDYDLPHFMTMPNLRIVYAEGCSISPLAIGQLIMRLPSLAIFQ